MANVAFRRIGGRVVPIRAREGKVKRAVKDAASVGSNVALTNGLLANLFRPQLGGKYAIRHGLKWGGAAAGITLGVHAGIAANKALSKRKEPLISDKAKEQIKGAAKGAAALAAVAGTSIVSHKVGVKFAAKAGNAFLKARTDTIRADALLAGGAKKLGTDYMHSAGKALKSAKVHSAVAKTAFKISNVFRKLTPKVPTKLFVGGI